MDYFSKTTQINDNGRVVIPKEVRDLLKVKAGDDVIFTVRGGEVRLTTRANLVKDLSGIFARDDGRDLTQELLDERRAEAAKKWS
jgi:AbrB family looped-hinge helix DNA binding protein